MKIFFFDCETTGLDPKLHAIHQLAVSIMINGEVVESINYKMRPHYDAIINDDALAVSGVTKKDLYEYPMWNEVYDKLARMLAKYVDKYNKKDKMFLAGYNNASFDNQFLREFFTRAGDKYFGSYFWSSPLDVFILASFKFAKMRHIMPDFKLRTVAEACGMDIDETKLHDAMYDIDLTIGIYKKILGLTDVK